MSPTETPLIDAIETICAEDRRYRREAYLFVVTALGATVQGLPLERQQDPLRRHLAGGELILGMIELARREFGPLAPTVFREWGVLGNEDVGTIVFQLVECGQLSARPEDSMDDFGGGPDLLKALELDPGRDPARPQGR